MMMMRARHVNLQIFALANLVLQRYTAAAAGSFIYNCNRHSCLSLCKVVSACPSVYLFAYVSECCGECVCVCVRLCKDQRCTYNA